MGLAGLAASALVAGAASAHDAHAVAASAHDAHAVAEISSGLYNSGKDIGMGMSGDDASHEDAHEGVRLRGEPKGSHASPAWEIWAYSQAAPPTSATAPRSSAATGR